MVFGNFKEEPVRFNCTLQGFQSMTQACGMLEMSDSRDAYLTSLCGHTLTDTSSLDHSNASRPDGITSPTGKPPAKC